MSAAELTGWYLKLARAPSDTPGMYPEMPHSGVPGRAGFPVVSCTLLLAAVLACAAADSRADSTWPAVSHLPSDGITLVEGDILTRDRQLTQRGIGLRGQTSPWPDGIVPYQIDAGLTPDTADLVRQAIAGWNEVSGVTLIPLGEVPEDLRDSHLLFQSGPGCASWVGRQGGEQPLWVGPTCGAGSIMHEIGHALGLEHEHTRPDRDEHIVIHFDRIDPTKLHNFEITDFRSRVLGDYDYASIMHYGPNFFSIDGSSTIEPLVPTAVPIGQRVAPSPGDLDSLARLYGTDLSLQAEASAATPTAADELVDIDVTLHVTNRSAQGANSLRLSLQAPGLVLTATVADGWQCGQMSDGVSCRRDRLQGNAHSPLHLSLRGRHADSELRATLDSVTPDSDMTNNRIMLVSGTGTVYETAPADTGIQAGSPVAVPLPGPPMVYSADGVVPVDIATLATIRPQPASTAGGGASAGPDTAIGSVSSGGSDLPVTVEQTYSPFDTVPGKQPVGPAVDASSGPVAGAFAGWLPLLIQLIRRKRPRFTVRHIGLIGKLVGALRAE